MAPSQGNSAPLAGDVTYNLCILKLCNNVLELHCNPRPFCLSSHLLQELVCVEVLRFHNVVPTSRCHLSFSVNM